MKKYLIVLFVIVALFQLWVPTQMIMQRENTLKTGETFKFETQVIDPSDPFRGKYITLNFKIDSAESNDSNLVKGQDIYLYFDKDENDYAILREVSPQKLESEEIYLKTTVSWVNKSEILFDLPFDRFYMNEAKAKPAETAYLEANRDDKSKKCYALVAVKNGIGVIKNVYLDDVSITEYIKD